MRSNRTIRARFVPEPVKNLWNKCTDITATFRRHRAPKLIAAAHAAMTIIGQVKTATLTSPDAANALDDHGRRHRRQFARPIASITRRRREPGTLEEQHVGLGAIMGDGTTDTALKVYNTKLVGGPFDKIIKSGGGDDGDVQAHSRGRGLPGSAGTSAKDLVAAEARRLDDAITDSLSSTTELREQYDGIGTRIPALR